VDTNRVQKRQQILSSNVFRFCLRTWSILSLQEPGSNTFKCRFPLFIDLVVAATLKGCQNDWHSVILYYHQYSEFTALTVLQIMQLSQNLPLPVPTMDASRKMSIAALSEADASSPALSSRSLKHEPYLGLPNLPQTPPDSTAGSPALKPYGTLL
jgi:hypothetical protein